MKGAVIYARYSCEKQNEASIEGQLRICNEFAEKNGLTVIETYIDRATTGTNDHRAEFQRMLSDSDKPQPWEIVLVYALDRFGRNSIEIAINKQRLKKNGKILISATQRTSMNIDGTQNLDGIILENVMIGIAEYYSAECFYGYKYVLRLIIDLRPLDLPFYDFLDSSLGFRIDGAVRYAAHSKIFQKFLLCLVCDCDLYGFVISFFTIIFA